MASPKLERLLLDSDFDLVDGERYLRALGFQTESVARLVASGEIPRDDDSLHVAYARRHRLILVCHDKHQPSEKRRKSRDHRSSGKPTPRSWYTEVAEKGGRVIEVQQGVPLQVVGMIIQHRICWTEFFESSHGVVYVHSTGCFFKDPIKLRSEFAKYKLKIQLPEPSGRLEQAAKRAKLARRPRRKKIERGASVQLPGMDGVVGADFSKGRIKFGHPSPLDQRPIGREVS